MVVPGPSRRFGELRAVWACDCDGDHSHWIIHLHSNTPSRQQLNQTTNHTNKKKLTRRAHPTPKIHDRTIQSQAADPINTYIGRSNQDTHAR
jgi:hypothetical protein